MTWKKAEYFPGDGDYLVAIHGAKGLRYKVLRIINEKICDEYGNILSSYNWGKISYYFKIEEPKLA